MPDATMEDFGQLAGCVIRGDNPILPQPEWGQDAAYIAFVLDSLQKRCTAVAEGFARLEGHIKSAAMEMRTAATEISLGAESQARARLHLTAELLEEVLNENLEQETS